MTNQPHITTTSYPTAFFMVENGTQQLPLWTESAGGTKSTGRSLSLLQIKASGLPYLLAYKWVSQFSAAEINHNKTNGAVCHDQKQLSTGIPVPLSRYNPPTHTCSFAFWATITVVRKTAVRRGRRAWTTPCWRNQRRMAQEWAATRGWVPNPNNSTVLNSPNQCNSFDPFLWRMRKAGSVA